MMVDSWMQSVPMQQAMTVIAAMKMGGKEAGVEVFLTLCGEEGN